MCVLRFLEFIVKNLFTEATFNKIFLKTYDQRGCIQSSMAFKLCIAHSGWGFKNNLIKNNPNHETSSKAEFVKLTDSIMGQNLIKSCNDLLPVRMCRKSSKSLIYVLHSVSGLSK